MLELACNRYLSCSCENKFEVVKNVTIWYGFGSWDPTTGNHLWIRFWESESHLDAVGYAH
jgi:hypothetical protein